MFTIVRQLLVRNPELITTLVGEVHVLFRVKLKTLKFFFYVVPQLALFSHSS